MTIQSINLEKGFFGPPLNISRGAWGGQEKGALYSSVKKLPYQLRIFLGKIFIFVGIHSVLGKFVWEKS